MTSAPIIPALRRPLASLLALLAALVLGLSPAQAARIKDLGSFEGLRANQLIGYGVVVGLAGTGDDSLDYASRIRPRVRA